MSANTTFANLDMSEDRQKILIDALPELDNLFTERLGVDPKFHADARDSKFKIDSVSLSPDDGEFHDMFRSGNICTFSSDYSASQEKWFGVLTVYNHKLDGGERVANVSFDFATKAWNVRFVL